MRYFTRGGQIFLHQLLMWAQVVLKLTLAFILLYVLVLAATILQKTTAFERSITWQHWLTKSFASQDKDILVEWNNGRTYNINAETFLNDPTVSYLVSQVKQKVTITARRLTGMMASLYLLCIFLLSLKGFMQTKTKTLRGTRLISPAKFKRHLTLRRKASSLHLGGVPLVKDSQYQHILMVGGTGSGKTQGILELLVCLREQGYKAIVLDPECTAVQYFYRQATKPNTPDHDIIVNPMDARARPLAFWQDANNESQLEYIAAALVPEPKSGADPFWHHAARVLFLETAKVVLKERQAHTGDTAPPGIKRLLSLLTTADLKVLEDVLKGTIAESLISRDAEKLALSVKATLSAHLRSLELLKDTTNGFSIRNWIHEQNDSWLFITSRDDKHETFKPLLSIILDIVANELLTLDENRHRKIALIIDEEASLNPSRSLQALRARGRKRGICIISAYQTLAQATALSNPAASQTLSSMYGTRVYFACHDHESARYASRDLGQKELLEHSESVSLGANTIRDGVSITQQRRIVDLVMPEEVMQLKAREAYLRLPGNYPITKIQVPICPLTVQAPGFIERTLVSTNDEPQPAANKPENNAKPATSSLTEEKSEIMKESDDYEHELF